MLGAGWTATHPYLHKGEHACLCGRELPDVAGRHVLECPAECQAPASPPRLFTTFLLLLSKESTFTALVGAVCRAHGSNLRVLLSVHSMRLCVCICVQKCARNITEGFEGSMKMQERSRAAAK